MPTQVSDVLHDGLSELLDFTAKELADRFVAEMRARFSDRTIAPSNGAAAVSNGGRSRKGRHLDMHCRIPGCVLPSKGPRFRYMCESHVKLPVREQKAAVAAYRRGVR